MTFETNEFFLKSTEEMSQSFAEWPEALASTLEIAERCSTEIELGRQLIPRYLPEGEDEKAYLRERVMEGMRQRYGDPPPAEAIERMEMELEVVNRMGFDAYFLIVWDFVKYAKDNGIAVGPGRGSAAGSLVAYCLQITDVDPLRYGLLFERFLNPERVSMPDIDIDFSVRGRERVMRYVTQKYGRESVAQIVTFGKMFPRAATRDAARVLGHDYGAGDRLAKLIPDPIMGRPPSFEDCLRDGEPLRGAYDSDPTAKQIIDVAKGLEGIVRNSSIHAAAVVIADRPLTDIVPLQLADAGTGEDGQRVYRTVTQYSMKPVEELGLLKMDFLGLRNLDVIEDALDIIARSTGERPDMTTLPLDDPGRTRCSRGGIPWACSSSSPRACRRRCARCARRSSTTSSRSTPCTARAPWTRSPRTRGASAARSQSSFPDPRLEPIIGPTYGVILYQEQAMQISKEIGGFSGCARRRPAQGDRQEEPRGDGQARARVPRGLPRVGHERAGHRLALDDEREVGRLLVQPLARRVLRAHRVPDGVAEGELPRRVHGGADLQRHGHEGQGALLRQPGGVDGHRDPAAGRQPLRPRVRRRRGQHPLRAGRREGRGLRRRGGDQGRARRGWERSSRSGTSAPASTLGR